MKYYRLQQVSSGVFYQKNLFLTSKAIFLQIIRQNIERTINYQTSLSSIFNLYHPIYQSNDQIPILDISNLIMDGFSEPQPRLSEIIGNTVSEDKRANRKQVPNLGKLGYHQLFYQRGQQLVVQELGGWERNCSLKQFYSLKEIHEKGIKKFKSTLSKEESESIKRRKRGYSIDTDINGAFYLNNWLSYEEYPCQKPTSEEKTSTLFYELLYLNWNKALQLIGSWQKTPQIATLEYILIGFKAISNLLVEGDKFSEHFLGRSTHEIRIKPSSDCIGGHSNFVNILEEDSKAKFMQIKSIPRKIECLRINLDFLVKFVNTYKIKTEDSYLQLCFKFLGNSVNQQSTNIPEQQDYYLLLLKLDIKLSDRLNFACKLLNDKKRKQFCSELEERLTQFPKLQNILFYTAQPISKGKQEKIEKICKCYLDKYGDLETIAYLAHEFSFLKKYYGQFRQALQLAYEHKQLERLQNYKWGSEKDGYKQFQEVKRGNRTVNSFFDVINVADERIGDWYSSADVIKLCEICSKKMIKTENFLECGKCRHGGHISHLLKWFQEYQNCPHIGCPCLCN